jgi:hypothetical protein
VFFFDCIKAEAYFHCPHDGQMKLGAGAELLDTLKSSRKMSGNQVFSPITTGILCV